jgi:putative PIN family toxin of toxin-antitoxin system
MGAVKIIPVVIDTNVLVSALLFGGKPGRLIDLWKNRRLRPFLSEEMIDELIRVLAYPKFDLTEKEIDYLLYAEILPFFDVAHTSTGPLIVEDDPHDDMFLRCADAAGAEFIISGDRHLLSLKSYKKIPILTPAKFLDTIAEDQESGA